MINQIEKKKITGPKRCPSFGSCSAPICPLDPMIRKGVWFPNEEICKKHFPPDWVSIQKKIQKRTRNIDRYFTFKMLTQNCRIGRGIAGIIPEGIGRLSLEAREKNWLMEHSPKKKLTELEKEVLRKRLKENPQMTKMNTRLAIGTRK